MKLRTYTSLALLLLVLPVRLATAQSLAELAKKEDARRKQVNASGKVYTNKDLPAVPAPAVPAPASSDPVSAEPPKTETATAAKPGDAPAKDGKDAAKDEKKDEAYWRKRVTSTRDSLTRSQTFKDALQTRLNALSTDFVNRDDPAQRAQIAVDRQKTLAEMERVSKEIAQFQKDLTDIADEARRAGVPAGWVR